MLKRSKKNKQARKNLTDLDAVILGQLIRGPAHGLQIDRNIEDETGRGVLPGSLYRALYRMESDGFVAGYWEEEDSTSSHQGPPRRYYKISGSGLQTLDLYRQALAERARLHGLLPEVAK